MPSRKPLAAAIALSVALPLQAAESLDPVSVTAAPFVTTVEDSPTAVDVVEGEEKRRQQGASLGALVEDIPGVSNISTGSQVGKPVIRGLSGSRIRVLSGGVAQDHQQYGVRHLPNVDPFLAERVEVVRGPQSVLYGSDALGGAVNLVPRAVPEAPGSSLLRGRVTTGFRGNNAEGMLGVEAEGARDGWGWTAALSRRDAGDLTTPDEPTFAESGVGNDPKFTGELDHTDYEILAGTLGLGHAGDYGRWSLRYTHWDNEQNFLLPNGKPLGQNLENDELALEGEFWAGEWLVKPRLVRQDNVRQAAPAGIAYQDMDLDALGLDVRRERTTLRLGAEHPRVAGWRGEVGVEAVAVDQDLRAGELTPDAERDGLAVYAFEERRFGPVRVQAGARLDRLEQSANNDAHRSGLDTRGREYEVFSGSLGANWEVARGWNLRAGLARGFRAPSIFELYADGVHGGVAAYQQGDPALTEETSLNTDLGLAWRGERANASITVYRNRIDDYIFLRNTGEEQGGLPLYRADQGDARLDGVELAAGWRIGGGLSLEGAFEAVDGELTDAGADLPLLPADTLRARLAWEHGSWRELRDLRAFVGVKHARAREAAGRYEPFSQFDAKPFGTASTDDYTLWSVGAGFDLALAGDRAVALDLRVENLLDEAYRDFLDTYKGYALGAGRNVMLTASVPFGS